MPVPKGVTNNPRGRPRTGQTEIDAIRRAIIDVGQAKGKTLWRHLIERCYVNDLVLSTVARKFMPEAHIIGLNGEMGNSTFSITIKTDSAGDSVITATPNPSVTATETSVTVEPVKEVEIAPAAESTPMLEIKTVESNEQPNV